MTYVAIVAFWFLSGVLVICVPIMIDMELRLENLRAGRREDEYE